MGIAVSLFVTKRRGGSLNVTSEALASIDLALNESCPVFESALEFALKYRYPCLSTDDRSPWGVLGSARFPWDSRGLLEASNVERSAFDVETRVLVAGT